MRHLPRPLSSFLVAVVTSLLSLGTASGQVADRWVPEGPRMGSVDLLAIERATATTPGAPWMNLGHALYTSADRGFTWRFSGVDALSDFGPIGALAVDEAHAGILWAASWSTVARSSDHGGHWSKFSDGTYFEAIGGQTPKWLASANGAIWGSMFVASEYRVVVRRGVGRPWERIYEIAPDAVIRAQALQIPPSATEPNLFLAVRFPSRPVFARSRDGGRSFEEITSLPLPEGGVADIVATPRAVYVNLGGDRAGIYKSTDQGTTWRTVLGGDTERFTARALTVDLRKPGTLYVYGAFVDRAGFERLWISRDGGETWKAQSGTTGWPPNHLRTEPGGSTLYAWSEFILARSDDLGASWHDVFVRPTIQGPLAQLNFHAGDWLQRALVIGEKVYRSSDGGRSWWPILRPGGLAAVDIDPDDSRRLIGVGGFGASLSLDGGATWTTRSYRLQHAESLNRLDFDTLLASGCGISRTTDNGETWRETLPCITPYAPKQRWIHKVEADPTHPRTVYALGFLARPELPHDVLTDHPSFLWRSDDAGGTWIKVARNLRTFAVDRSRGRLFATRDRNLVASDDFGHTWHAEATAPYVFDDLVIDPTDQAPPSQPARIFGATVGNQATCSVDGGTSWRPLPQPFVGPELGRLFFDPILPRTLYAASRWEVRRYNLPQGQGFCE